jgi:hypothetical protein
VATLPPLAAVEDLVARLGSEITDGSSDQARAAAALEDVSAFIREEAHKLWLDPDDPTVAAPPAVIRTIALRVAERSYRNPEGFSSESAADYSYQRNGATGEGGLYFTERELKQIRRAAGRTGMWTQQVTRGDLYAQGTRWMEDSFGLELFPVDVIDECY